MVERIHRLISKLSLLLLFLANISFGLIPKHNLLFLWFE